MIGRLVMNDAIVPAAKEMGNPGTLARDLVGSLRCT